MFNPPNDSSKSGQTAEQEAAYQARIARKTALDHAVDLAKAGASRYGAKGYTSHTLLTYAADITAFITDGTVPSDPEVQAKLKETDPAGAPGPETREYLLNADDIDTDAKPLKRSARKRS